MNMQRDFCRLSEYAVSFDELKWNTPAGTISFDFAENFAMLWLSGSEAAVGSFFPTVHIFGNPVRCARSGNILRRAPPQLVRWVHLRKKNATKGRINHHCSHRIITVSASVDFQSRPLFRSRNVFLLWSATVWIPPKVLAS